MTDFKNGADVCASRPASPALLSLLGRLIVEDSGQDLIEYALVAALVGLGAVTAMKGLATHISTAFNGIGTSLTSAV